MTQKKHAINFSLNNSYNHTHSHTHLAFPVQNLVHSGWYFEYFLELLVQLVLHWTSHRIPGGTGLTPAVLRTEVSTQELPSPLLDDLSKRDTPQRNVRLTHFLALALSLPMQP